MSKISVLEQALLQVKNLEDAVKQNAKGILESTMKQELNDLLKEQAEEEEEFKTPEEEEEVTGSEEEVDTDVDADAEDTGLETDDETGDEFGADMGDEAGEEGDEFGDEDLDTDDEEDMLDLTGASDAEVLKVFKAMKPEDGIVVKKDGNKLEVNTGTDEFIIKLEDETPEMDEEEGSEEEEGFGSEEEEGFGSEEEEEGFGSEEEEEGSEEEEEETGELAEEEEENVYEIEIDEEEEEEEECDKELEECGDKMPEEEMKEAARTKWNPHGDKGGMNRAGLKSKKVFKAGSGQMNEEVERLKKQNAEYKKALVLFKEKLNEVAVFNANLAYATRLFTEQSTTKQEKLNILKRFDSISTLTESKNLYKTIQTELSNKKPVTESVAEKISNTPTSSASKEVLSEAKAYENPQFARMKELMKKVK